ncbi:MAG: class A beta-lactamase [Gammaproteobacteria bacterium]|nr:class A beta-lactamase [Gammaproteobacteria bacterium]
MKLAVGSTFAFSLPAMAKGRPGDVGPALAELERQCGGRLGVGMINMQTGQAFGHRGNERFGMCSTFKLALAAIVLRKAEQGSIELDAAVHYTQQDMVTYAPVTERYLERGFMTVAELAEAAQTTSDNVAANLLLDLIGGPSGFTKELRAIGDDTTRLDRYEPDLNLVPPGELRDTTTPAAMASTVRHLLSGSLLSAEHAKQLRTWMESTQTGLQRLRAGFPSSWRAGDKTGTAIAEGMPNRYNDVAAAWPDDGTPEFVVAAFYEADGTFDRVRDRDNAVLRKVGQIAATAFS